MHITPRRTILYFGLYLCFTSCSSSSIMIQPQINSLVVAKKYNHAIKLLEDNQESYGPRNQLLYWLDYGLTLHYADQYEESIRAFKEAKRRYDDLYTVSVTNETSTWFMNDLMAPYRGEDFERVMINMFQALNYAAIGDIEGALVEVRDVDVKLNMINRQYPQDQRNVYKADAFARMMMGILFEAGGRRQDYNDAFIAYQKAVKIYEKDYSNRYEQKIPSILQENMLSLAQWMGDKEYAFYRKKFAGMDFVRLNEKQNKGEVYFFIYEGFAPIKHQVSLALPLPGGYIGKLAFPVFDKRTQSTKKRVLKATDERGNNAVVELEPVQPLDRIALRSLEDRRLRVVAKASIRSAGKYFLSREVEQNIKSKSGENSARWFRYFANLYNLTSEKADLRSWQTLPAEIHMGRLLLDPGSYVFSIDSETIGTIDVKRGEKRFIVHRK